MMAGLWIRHTSITTRLVLAMLASTLFGCGAARPAPSSTPEPATVAAPAPALSPLSTEAANAQVRAARSSCSTELGKQGLETIDFVNFNRLDNTNWDATIRVRRKGQVVRVGCRYDTRVAAAYVYEPAAADGGKPWGAAGPPSAAAMPATSTAAMGAAPARPTAPPPSAKPMPTPAAPTPAPGANINLSLVSDTTARGAIARTRDACLAEAKRRKFDVSDFDSFRRADASAWEAQLLLAKSKVTRTCRYDIASGKASIR